MVKGELEYILLQDNHRVAGIDEVGRGCLAGPVYSAAAILDYSALIKLPTKLREKIRDSKTLSKKQRSEMIPVIQDTALDWAVSFATVAEIENIGIVKATFLAMHRSLKKLPTSFDYLLIDGHKPLEAYHKPQRAVVKGDHFCYCIAAASIIAKEARDDFMRKKSADFPDYGFESHVGYGTKAHLAALKKHGVCPLHRKNFAPIRAQIP